MNEPLVPAPAPAPAMPAPRVEAPAPVQLRVLGFGAPLRWLALGLRDLGASLGIGVFYGLCFWGMALVLGLVFHHKPEYTMTMVSGCLLVGPFLGMGLYDASRRLARGEQPQLSLSLTCWDRHLGSMGLLVLVVMLLELLWGRASLVVFAVFFDTGMPSTASVLQAVFNPRNWQFVAVYTAVGGLFASLVFCSMVVSLPMILDRDTDAITAAITSFRVVFDNTAVMVFWGLLVTAMTLLALWPWGLGLVLLGPWLGHATWHAYREAVVSEEAAPPAAPSPRASGPAD